MTIAFGSAFNTSSALSLASVLATSSGGVPGFRCFCSSISSSIDGCWRKRTPALARIAARAPLAEARIISGDSDCIDGSIAVCANITRLRRNIKQKGLRGSRTFFIKRNDRRGSFLDRFSCHVNDLPAMLGTKPFGMSHFLPDDLGVDIGMELIIVQGQHSVPADFRNSVRACNQADNQWAIQAEKAWRRRNAGNQ